MILSRFFIFLCSVFLLFSVFSVSPSDADDVIARGDFVGKSGHRTVGSVEIIRDGSDYVLRFGDNFSLDGAPGPWVGFGRSGSYISESELGALKRKTGGQDYALPSDFESKGYDSVFVWCRPFKVPLGIAVLSSSPSSSY